MNINVFYSILKRKPKIKPCMQWRLVTHKCVMVADLNSVFWDCIFAACTVLIIHEKTSQKDMECAKQSKVQTVKYEVTTTYLFFGIVNTIFEMVPPQNFLWEIWSSGLCCVSTRFHHTLQSNNKLKSVIKKNN